MAMSKEDWKRVEKRLGSLYLVVKLICDGFELSLYLSRVKNNQLGITFHVNGCLNYEWFVNDCEERRRFFRPITKFVHSKKYRDSLKKCGKKYLRERGVDPDKKFVSYSYYWNNIKQLKRHLEQNNTEITLVKNEEVAHVTSSCLS